MTSISKHIEQLLTQHQCVIVPNLGGFVIYKEIAKVEHNTLSAPCKKVRFNSLLSYHDGLLAEAIMKEKNIDYNSAISIINIEVENIKEQINKGNCVIFGKLGRFTYTNNKFSFYQDKHDFLPENLGLSSIKLNKINRNSIEIPTQNKQKSIVIPIPNNSNKIIRYAASIAIVFLLTILSPRTSQHTQTARLRFDSITFKNLNIPSSTNIENAEIIEEPKAESQTNIAPIKEKTNTKNKYHIVIASFPDLQKAEEYLNNNQNFAYQIVEKSNKYRISECGFKTYKEALHYYKTVKKEKKSWILKM